MNSLQIIKGRPFGNLESFHENLLKNLGRPWELGIIREDHSNLLVAHRLAAHLPMFEFPILCVSDVPASGDG